MDVAGSRMRPGTAARPPASPCPTVYPSALPWQTRDVRPGVCRVDLTRGAEAVVEAADGKGRRRATEQWRCRGTGGALRLGARLFWGWLGRASNCGFSIRRRFGRMSARRCHRGMFTLGCRRLGLRSGWLDPRLVVRRRGLILTLRSEQIAYEAADAAWISSWGRCAIEGASGKRHRRCDHSRR
jgi:hypothetical protein